MAHLTVEHVAQRKDVDYYRVSAGKHGGESCTVRVGFHGVFACLGCVSATCIHADAAESFARSQAREDAA